MIVSFTVWDHMDGCTKKYSFSSSGYLLSCLVLESCMINDILVGAPVHGKDIFDGLNSIDIRMLKLSMSKILNPGLFIDYTHFYNFMHIC